MIQLKLQKLIETIKENKVEEALEYASTQILPQIKDNVIHIPYNIQIEKSNGTIRKGHVPPSLRKPSKVTSKQSSSIIPTHKNIQRSQHTIT
jgi:hypothetical protein